MKIAFRYSILCIMCFITFSLVGCVLTMNGIVKVPNNQPTVEELSVPDMFEPGETLEFSIIANDPDGDTLTYTWKVDSGELNTTTGSSVKWTAPKDVVAVNVIVSVNDGTSKPIKVEKMLLSSQPKTFANYSTRVLTGNTKQVYSTAFSPDGKIIVSGGRDDNIRLWDAATGQLLRTFTTDDRSVTSVSFSPDGKTIAAACGSEIYSWDVATGLRLQTLKEVEDFRNIAGFYCISFSPDGKTIASGGGPFGTILRLWNADTGAGIHTLKGHERPVKGVSFSPDGKILASASEDGTIRLWDTTTGDHLQALILRQSGFLCVSFSPDGKIIASGSGYALILWDTETGRRLRTTIMGDAQVASLSFSPNGKTIATGDSLDNLRLWDVATGAEIKTFKGHTKWISSVAFSPDGRILMSGSGDGTIRIYE